MARSVSLDRRWLMQFSTHWWNFIFLWSSQNCNPGFINYTYSHQSSFIYWSFAWVKQGKHNVKPFLITELCVCVCVCVCVCISQSHVCLCNSLPGPVETEPFVFWTQQPMCNNETQWNGQNRANQQNMPIYRTYSVARWKSNKQQWEGQREKEREREREREREEGERRRGQLTTHISELGVITKLSS